jgi:hypothetical protein
MELEFSLRLRKILSSGFMKIHQLGAEFPSNERTGGHDEANSRFSLFCERA